MPRCIGSARPSRRVALAVAALALLACSPAAVAAAVGEQRLQAGTAAPSPPDAASGRVIVVWEEGVDRPERVEARDGADVSFVRTLGDARFQLLRTEPGRSVADAIATLRDDPAVRTAARETYDVLHATTNDPLFGQLWGLHNAGLGVAGFAGAVAGADVNAPAAWDRTRGSSSVVVADLDSGYRFDHPDLAPVAWANAADPPNGADDDGNGIVDDAHGADFVGASANAPVVDGDPTDDNLVDGGHGVHTAGTIGAAGNDGVGMTGVAQDVRIMPLRVCGYYTAPDPDDSGTVCPSSAQIQAINYAGAHGVRIVNMSLGGTFFNAAVRDVLAANPGVLFVISAGNDGSDNDVEPHYPCNYEPQTSGVAGAIDNVLCVAATDQADGLAAFSDRGARSVDVGAPGTEILSAYPALDAPFEEDFEANDFGARWTTTGRTGGFARTDESPLTSFGMSDSPGGAPAADAMIESTSVAVSVPAGSGACRLSQTRHVAVDGGGTFQYFVLGDGVEAFASAFITTSGTVTTVPILGLGGTSVQLRFRFLPGSAPEPGDGVWLDDLRLECYAPLAAAPGWELLDGTSMAAPHVSGAAALLLSLNPAAATEQLRAALLATVDPLPSLAGRTTTGGRVDAASALDEIRQPDTAISSAPRRSTRSRRATFAFARADAPFAGGFECQLDGGAFAACSSPATYTTLRGGRHAFAVRARSPKGVVADPSPATASWTVTQCKVPRLKGKTLRRARRALRRARCTLGRARRPRRGSGARRGRGIVVVRSSRPRAGAIRVDGAKVNVSLAPRPRPRRRARRPRAR